LRRLLTPSQQQAITARGNVLVLAGAGTGKTRTLVERCLSCLLDEHAPASLDEILMVTFTEAAAAEMRQRIRLRLAEERQRQPHNARWDEQLALFETAHIGTLHGFCFQLVRQHFFELQLDPQLIIMAEEDSRLLAEETLDKILQEHYAGHSAEANAVQQLIQAQGRGGDKPIRKLVFRLHHYTQTRPDPEGWFAEQLAMYRSPEPQVWTEWLRQGLQEFRFFWEPLLDELAATGNQLAANCRAALKTLSSDATRNSLESILAVLEERPRGKAWHKPLEKFQDEAEFLSSLLRPVSKSEPGPQQTAEVPSPLAQDWGWVREQMLTLLKLAQQFTAAFTDTKREQGALDFHDLEQYALKLLWNVQTRRPSPVALQWRQKLRFVFVDEYQDINAAQDKIIEALSRDGAQANRFLVGDVKQSIYRFRLADPHIFQAYAHSWRNGKGTAISLTDNFRSREGILALINSLFGTVMLRDIGGIDYDQEAQLCFGAPEERRPLSARSAPGPCVELHLRLKAKRNLAEPAEGELESSAASLNPMSVAQVLELAESEKEARLVALGLRELKAQGFPVWDEAAGGFRPVDWSDMAVLLRAPANKSESFAKEFSRLNVPLLVERSGFYENIEVTDLLSLLQILDNPLQDLPLLAVLRSPFVGLNIDELALVRLAAPKTRFWTALTRWVEIHARDPSGADGQTGTFSKLSAFLERFARWRRLARQVSLSRCLETVLSETHYPEWLLTQPRGEQRYANVERFLGLAQRFDHFQRQGLFRFVRFIEAQQDAEAEPEVAAVSDENSVRLMSIHQSKGLEFPVVVVADLGKAFNLGDLHAEMILDETYGVCPQIKPPHSGQRYPSLPHWLARRRQVREVFGEELRLLYVAMTRARDRLILTGSFAESKLQQFWSPARGHSGPLKTSALLSARSYCDWLALWFSEHSEPRKDSATQGEIPGLAWRIHQDSDLDQGNPSPGGQSQLADSVLSATPAEWQALQRKLAWQYPFIDATCQPAKTSVSAIRRAANEDEFSSSASRFTYRSSVAFAKEDHISLPQQHAGGTTADIGSAHHTFLQHVSLPHVGTVAGLKKEARRLQSRKALRADEVGLLDFEALAAFWSSELGQSIRARSRFVQRELPFTLRLAAPELLVWTGDTLTQKLEDEFVVVQGVADLVVLKPQEIWLLDFKTDRLQPNEIAARAKSYEPQLRLYAAALSRIYRRPASNAWLYFLSCRAAVEIRNPNSECRKKGECRNPN
jgi:ATP-dependent helicase/nuclease subunit A